VTRSLLAVDRLSAWVGKACGWTIVLLTLVVGVSVIFRYLFRITTVGQLGVDPNSALAWPIVWFFDWAFDTSFILYGTLFMMAGPYTLSRNAHVRGDMFYREWPVRVQAAVDLICYLAFFLPGILALVYSGWLFAEMSRSFNERSPATPGGPVIWPFKFVIPLAGLFMLVQGGVEIIRAIDALRTGEWPQRLSDVEETETRLAQETQV
jgi:TRAP-type mannitol/chloroaromatic compound transport system permease small subunit